MSLANADSREIRTIFVGVVMGLALASISQTLVTTALPTIVGDLSGFESLSWVISAYMLTSAIVVPFAGKLADLFGPARLFKSAIVVFATGSLLCALSTSMPMLIAARSIQGAGGGAIMTLAFTLIAHIVPVRERARYQSYIASMFAITSMTGPLVGGFLVDHLSWRWAFHLNVLLSITTLWIVRRRLPADGSRDHQGVDHLGACLLIVTLMSAMLVAVWGGQQHAWTSPIIVTLIVVATAGAVGFVICERSAAEPIVPPVLFTKRVVRVSSAIGFLTGVTMFGIVVYTPTFLQVSLGASATRSGLLLIPLMGCLVLGSNITGRVVSRTGRYRPLAITGCALLVISAGLLTTLSADSTPLQPSLYVGFLGAGLGLLMPVTLVAVQNSVDKSLLGAATSANQLMRKMGATLGLAVLGGIFNARVTGRLAAATLPAGTTPADILESPSSIGQLPEAAAHAARSAVADGAVLVFAVAFVIAIIALLISFRLPDDRIENDAAERSESNLTAGGEAVAGQ